MNRTVLKTVIADDEPLALDLLAMLLEGVAGVEVVAKCKNGREAIAAVQTHKPDLIFLDIQMPEINGFDVIKAIQSDTMPLIVFVTAYEQYAIDAFELYAVDYVLKPLDQNRVKLSVTRALDRFHTAFSESHKGSVIAAAEKISFTANKVGVSLARLEKDQAISQHDGKTLLVRDGGAVSMVPFEDIAWVDAAGDYMCIHANSKTYVVRVAMKDLLIELDATLFKRIHRSTIVNIRYVVKVVTLPKGERTLYLENGEQLKLSRNYREALGSIVG